MKVLVYGSINIDYVYQMDHFVRGGETTASFGRNCYSGGKGLNQSIAFARSGADVWHAGAVGKDDNEMVMNALTESGVHTEFISIKDGPSGHTIIQTDKTGDNCIILFGGANQAITQEEVRNTIDHFDAGDYLILQNEINQMPYIIEYAHQKGMTIVLNPSPMDEKIFEMPLKLVDYFILNEIEGCTICKAEDADFENEAAGEALLKKLQDQFPNTKVILTLGKHGSLYGCGDEIVRQPIFPVKAVDTTAAGDTFTGYFFGSLIRGLSVKDAMATAAKASAIAVTRPGAAPSIPTWDEVQSTQL